MRSGQRSIKDALSANLPTSMAGRLCFVAFDMALPASEAVAGVSAVHPWAGFTCRLAILTEGKVSVAARLWNRDGSCQCALACVSLLQWALKEMLMRLARAFMRLSATSSRSCCCKSRIGCFGKERGDRDGGQAPKRGLVSLRQALKSAISAPNRVGSRIQRRGSRTKCRH